MYKSKWIFLIFFVIHVHAMLSSWTNKKHDPAWLCKEHYIHILRQKFFLVMKHDQLSWRNLELLCEAQPKGLHKDINFLQNPLSFCIMLWKWISNYCEKWFMSECLAINAIESQPVLYILFYKVVFKSTVLESICFFNIFNVCTDLRQFISMNIFSSN